MAQIVNLFVVLCIVSTFGTCLTLKVGKRQSKGPNCICGVFLTSQLTKGSVNDTAGDPVITVDAEEEVVCGSKISTSQCSTICVQELMKFMPTSSSIICGSVNRDIHKEIAHLFLKVCDQPWTKSKISTKKEVCCKDSVSIKCPVT